MSWREILMICLALLLVGVPVAILIVHFIRRKKPVVQTDGKDRLLCEECARCREIEDRAIDMPCLVCGDRCVITTEGGILWWCCNECSKAEGVCARCGRRLIS